MRKKKRLQELKNTEQTKAKVKKKGKKRYIISGIAIILVICLVAGFALYRKNTILFSYADQTVTKDYAEIYLRMTQYQMEVDYKDSYEENMWDSIANDEDGNEISLEELIKSNLLTEMKKNLILVKHADEYLDETAMSDAEAEAEDYIDSYVDMDAGKTFLKKTDYTKEDLIEVYTDKTIANKVYSKIIESADVTVKDEEAYETSAQYLYFLFSSDNEAKTAKENATNAKKAIDGGMSFEDAAAEYNGRYQDETYITGRSELGSEYEEEVAKLKKGKVSDVIKLEGGYIIIKVTKEANDDNLEVNKTVVLSDKQTAAYNEVFDKWEKTEEKSYELNESLWDSITFKDKSLIKSE